MGISYSDPDVDSDEHTIQLAALTPTDNGVIIGNGTAWTVESGSTFRASVGLAIGSDVQAYDADLAQWAGVNPADYLTTSAAASTYLTVSAAALAYQPLDTDLSAWAGVNPSSYSTTSQIAAAYQPLDATITAWAALTFAANKLGYATGNDAFATTDLTIGGRLVIATTFTDPNADRVFGWDDSAGAFIGFTLGTGLAFNDTALELDADLQTWAGLTPSAFFQTLVDDASASAARTTLGLVIGTDVKAQTATTTTQFFSASGTWTKPAGLTSVVVEVRGGGGGGGGVSSAAGYIAGGGGGEGGYSRKTIAAGSLGSTETVTIGAGGTEGANTGGTGGTGGTTSFGAHATAAGGTGGGGATGVGQVGAGIGGTGASGLVNLKAGAGGAGLGVTGILAVGGGGGGHGAGHPRASTGAGNAGTNGGGGSGACSLNASSAALGGVGGDGYVIVTEYY